MRRYDLPRLIAPPRGIGILIKHPIPIIGSGVVRYNQFNRFDHAQYIRRIVNKQSLISPADMRTSLTLHGNKSSIKLSQRFQQFIKRKPCKRVVKELLFF